MGTIYDLFEESKGQPVSYKEHILVRADKFPVKNDDTLIASIEKTNAEKRQGFVIDITGSCEMNGRIIKQGKGIRLLFWEDTMPKQVEIKVFTKQDFVLVYNIWENINTYLIRSPTGEPMKKESKATAYGHNGAAMIVEDIENGRRYRCNDGYPDEDFNDILFTIHKLKSQSDP